MEDPDLMHVSFCTFSNLRRATRMVSQLYDEAMKPTGLKTTQCMVLAMIHRSGKSTVTELAQAMGMDQTSMTRSLNILKKQDLIERISDESDRRRRLITLTPKGEEILMLSLKLREEAQAKMIAGLGPEDTRIAVELLQKMTAVAQK